MSDDGGLTSANEGTVTIDFANVNDAPIAVNDAYTDGVEDTDYTGNVLTNDTDVDADDDASNFTATLVSGSATNGSVVLNNDGSFTFTPSPTHFVGQGIFRYTVSDDGGLTSANEGTVTIDFANVNDAPVAVNDAYTDGVEDTDYTGNVLTNDTDVDEDDDLSLIHI